jgi:7-keto-8-aminopelargonate synthetase-like enzyme
MDVVMRSAPRKQQYLENTGEIRKCINLGSYNYLGFANQVRLAGNWSPVPRALFAGTSNAS